MAKETYRNDPKTCEHRGPVDARLCGSLLYLLCSDCGSVRKAWGRPVTAARLAAAGLGKLTLARAVGGAK